jgi:secreted Zn-dependent insulinase-like peptidase
VDLTEEGLKHRYEVIDIIFAYIHKLQDSSNSGRTGGSGVPQYVYKEVGQLSSIGFNFSEKVRNLVSLI